jgi:DNA-binding MarR family transcriptional regulator
MRRHDDFKRSHQGPGLRPDWQTANGYPLIFRTTAQGIDGMSADKGMKARSAADIARNWQLEGGVGFLLRLLEARYDVLYQNLTGQSDITPRQFGVLIALYQQGPVTPSNLAEHISCDRNTLSEMLKRMTARKLIAKKRNSEDRRSIQVQITAKGEEALLAVVPAAAELQNMMLAPLRKEDRVHFLKCMLAIAKAEPPASAAHRVDQAATAISD